MKSGCIVTGSGNATAAAVPATRMDCKLDCKKNKNWAFERKMKRKNW